MEFDRSYITLLGSTHDLSSIGLLGTADTTTTTTTTRRRYNNINGGGGPPRRTMLVARH